MALSRRRLGCFCYELLVGLVRVGLGWGGGWSPSCVSRWAVTMNTYASLWIYCLFCPKGNHYYILSLCRPSSSSVTHWSTASEVLPGTAFTRPFPPLPYSTALLGLVPVVPVRLEAEVFAIHTCILTLHHQRLRASRGALTTGCAARSTFHSPTVLSDCS